MSNDLKEFTYINELMDLYGPLLTDKQRSILIKYYEFNLSLSEISEELNITRSAVSDTLEHAKEKLISYENKLKLNEKQCRIKEIIKNSSLNEKEKNEILKELTYGIWSITR